MTTAIRGFKLEATDASRVVDVYSNLASHTAVTQGELAIGMSKTASSLESVGASFEESSAMIATMVAVTRESSTNIGSAMKSIAARYGEMKKDVSSMIDEEGEALSYNKVDTALQTVGISLKDSTGQFRNMTDVIIELGEKWDTLDSV
jgi:phage tail tape measure protein, TP901 family, core region